MVSSDEGSRGIGAYHTRDGRAELLQFVERFHPDDVDLLVCTRSKDFSLRFGWKTKVFTTVVMQPGIYPATSLSVLPTSTSG